MALSKLQDRLKVVPRDMNSLGTTWYMAPHGAVQAEGQTKGGASSYDSSLDTTWHMAPHMIVVWHHMAHSKLQDRLKVVPAQQRIIVAPHGTWYQHGRE